VSDLTPDLGDVYVSNCGAGPIRAVVRENKDGRVLLLRWDHSLPRGRCTWFTLPARFFSSPACGWVRIKKGAPAR